ncbi:MAG: serine acetyltransferase [Oscillospiraceae bacterium]|nr:serine acetyltransferase [Oscillospiraceae bacterium]
MIDSKEKLNDYLLQDKRQLGISRKRPRPFIDHIWKYEIELRKYEYWLNTNNSIFTIFMRKVYQFKHYRSGIKLGICIPPNTCGKGLSIAHNGCIQINENARIGENLRVHEGVTIGASGGFAAPQIGNNVFLGSGAKVMGDIRIADDCAVGAGAVVVKDVKNNGVTVAGVPARVVSENNSYPYVFWFNDGKKI